MSHSPARDRRFPESRFRTAYAANEVELFVMAVEDALRSPFLEQAEHLLSERERGR